MMKKYAKYMPMSGFPAKKGSALQMSISSIVKDKDKDAIVRFFVEMAPQVKDKPPSGSSESPFDWDQKIFISLKEEEVGRMLACFRGRVGEVKVIHKYPIDAPKEEQKTSTLNIKAGEYNGEVNWNVQLRQQVGTADAQFYSVYLQPEDVELIIVILEQCVRQMFRI